MIINYIGMFDKIAAITARRIPTNTFYKRLDAKAAFAPRNTDLFFGYNGRVADYKKVDPYAGVLGSYQADAAIIPGKLRVNYKEGITPRTFDRPKDFTKSVAFKKPRHIRLAEKGYGRFLPATTRKFGESADNMYDRIIKHDLGHTQKPGLLNHIKTTMKTEWLTNPRYRAEVGGFIGGAIAHLPQLFQ